MEEMNTCCWHQNMRPITGFQSIKVPCLVSNEPRGQGNVNFPSPCNMPLAPAVEPPPQNACSDAQAEQQWTIIGTCESKRYAPLLQYTANFGANSNGEIQFDATGVNSCCGGRKIDLMAAETGSGAKDFCKSNRCRPEAFYFPKVAVARTASRTFYLLARPIVLPVLEQKAPCFSRLFCAPTGLKFEYAVSALPDCRQLVRLPAEPQQVPGQCATTTDFYESAYLQILDGDAIYIPGQFGAFDVKLFADVTAGPFRANASVMRGYSPIRRLQGRVFTSNSGLRNFNSLPSAAGLLRPW